ncbi:MAG: hypothetical protein IKX79_03180 [Desulfovibrionaceae bacterium]|nr:hypothetical protein [Desulfovibrionaceae bacterium]
MRYLKVLILVLIFFLVMLFFVDNQAAFTTPFQLTLNPRFMDPLTTKTPVPCYYLLLASFVLGGLITLAMLIWDRVSCTARLSLAKLRASSLEKDLRRAAKQNDANEAKIKELTERIKTLTSEIDSLKRALKEGAKTLSAEKK